MTLIDPNAVESDLQVAIASLEKKLTAKNTHPLKYVCEDLGLVPPPKPKNAWLVKKDWVHELSHWVSSPCLFESLILENTDPLFLILAAEHAILLGQAPAGQIGNSQRSLFHQERHC